MLLPGIKFKLFDLGARTGFDAAFADVSDTKLAVFDVTDLGSSLDIDDTRSNLFKLFEAWNFAVMGLFTVLDLVGASKAPLTVSEL